ncbi:hypothetical protein POG22_06470 [Geitlerinema sp. CS-897]|uniref:hypothetical protein n=1 Tax=Baaleninema simplex TaxID=2862350 RepID=UPI00034B18DE|nr:hypothetical protein [Baaleninema simplex]MDC0832655.1 hypothetical protein [Geitlerinema sp. CS-897]
MTDRSRQYFSISTLPLTVYREVVAHLRQIDGVDAGLLPQTATDFDYYRSQIGGLWIETATEADATCRSTLERVLAYYGDRFGPWQAIEVES